MRKFIRYLFSFLLSFLLIISPPALAASGDTCTGFVGCVTGKFGSVFPLDIFANVPQDKIDCPKITFSFYEASRDFDLCFLLQIIAVAKYPIIASLLMKFYIQL